jgi:hypothetical protein
VRPKNDVVYVYKGDGDHLPGIPARDLTADDLESVDVKQLEASGLYEKARSAGKGGQ